MNHSRRPRPFVAVAAVLGLLLDPLAPGLAAASASQGAAPAKAPATQPVKPSAPPAPAKPAAPAGDVDGGWPRVYTLASGGSILVYQPQVATWDQQKHMVAFSAVSYRTASAQKPAMGTLKFEADTQVALTERLVNFQKMRITEASFQTVPKEQVREITDQVDKSMIADDRVIALDRVLASLDKSGIVVKNV